FTWHNVWLYHLNSQASDRAFSSTTSSGRYKMFSRVSYGNDFPSLIERSSKFPVTPAGIILSAADSRQARLPIAVWYSAATPGATAASCEAILRRRDGEECERE